MVTINMTDLGVCERRATRFFSKLLARVRRWWVTRPNSLGSFDWIAVHANPRGSAHVHWLIRVPQPHQGEFDEMVLKYVRKEVGFADLKTAVHFQPVAKHELHNRVKYIVKGVPAHLQKHFHLTRVADEGIVYGRRAAVSRSLGASARELSGWKRRRASTYRFAA